MTRPVVTRRTPLRTFVSEGLGRFVPRFPVYRRGFYTATVTLNGVSYKNGKRIPLLVSSVQLVDSPKSTQLPVNRAPERTGIPTWESLTERNTSKEGVPLPGHPVAPRRSKTLQGRNKRSYSERTKDQRCRCTWNACCRVMSRVWTGRRTCSRYSHPHPSLGTWAPSRSWVDSPRSHSAGEGGLTRTSTTRGLSGYGDSVPTLLVLDNREVSESPPPPASSPTDKRPNYKERQSPRHCIRIFVYSYLFSYLLGGSHVVVTGTIGSVS